MGKFDIPKECFYENWPIERKLEEHVDILKDHCSVCYKEINQNHSSHCPYCSIGNVWRSLEEIIEEIKSKNKEVKKN